MTSLTEIFGRIIGDEHVGFKVAEYLRENPHAKEAYTPDIFSQPAHCLYGWV